jgi:uncharacterized membrane protein
MYLVLKLVHVASVVLFLGNITTGLFWHRHAVRTRDPGKLAHAVEGIIRSDRWFTGPGAVAITVTGIGLAQVGKLPILGTGWIAVSLFAFIASGAIFGMRVAPLQRRLLALARASAFDATAYHALARRWEIWGGIALALPLVAMALMVLKPAF